MQIRLVVFDLGRVLMRICDSFEQACAHAGIEAPPAKIDPGMLKQLLLRNDIGALDADGFAAEMGRLANLSPENVQAMSRAFLLGAYPGGAQLIDELHAHGVATACLSNTNHHHWRIMNDAAESAHFPLHRLTYQFASHLVRARKPDAAIYEHLERQTGIAPAAILFFDDLAENVAAARARGWNAVQVDPGSADPIALMRGEIRRAGIAITR